MGSRPLAKEFALGMYDGLSGMQKKRSDTTRAPGLLILLYTMLFKNRVGENVLNWMEMTAKDKRKRVF